MYLEDVGREKTVPLALANVHGKKNVNFLKNLLPILFSRRRYFFASEALEVRKERSIMVP